jgi:hypothetical protein
MEAIDQKVLIDFLRQRLECQIETLTTFSVERMIYQITIDYQNRPEANQDGDWIIKHRSPVIDPDIRTTKPGSMLAIDCDHDAA